MFIIYAINNPVYLCIYSSLFVYYYHCLSSTATVHFHLEGTLENFCILPVVLIADWKEILKKKSMLKYAKSYIREIIKFYVEHPVYLFLSITLSCLFVSVLLYIFPNWEIYQYMTLFIASIPAFILIVGQTASYWKETKLEKEYDAILEEPLEQKFIIPTKAWTTINYGQQTDEPQRVKEIDIPANTKAIIIIRTNSKLDLEIKDSQYNFGGDKRKNPKIIAYKNPYYTKSMQWFEDDPFDWHGIYHLKGTRTMLKDVTYIDGFEIQTHNKGTYTFDMQFIVLSKKYGKLNEEKTKELKTRLTLNVV